jgi:AcrR family transcriptional regulator
MGVQERRERQKHQVRHQILDAAREIFAAEGVEALTMRRVAERIEYSPTTIYLHFKDKAELVQAICDETFAGLIKRLEELAKKHKNPFDYLDAGLRAYVDFGLKHPSHYWVTFVVGPPSVAYEYEGSSGQRAFEFLRGTVRACIDAGLMRKVDVDATAQMLWMTVHGLVAQLVGNKSFPFVARQKLIDAQMDMLLRGLSAEK